MKIAHVTSEHCADISAIERESFLEARSYDMINRAIQSDNAEILVALEDGTVVGYVWREYQEIISVAIAPEYRGRGIARMLFDQLLSGGEVGEIYLEVRQSNVSARVLYDKLGFEEVGVRKKYYTDGDSAIVLRKSD